MSTCSPAAVADAFGQGQTRWPGLRLSAPAFAQHVQNLGIADETLLARAADLYLAAACAAGDEVALEAFDGEYLSQIPIYVSRLDVPPHLDLELRQQVRLKILLSDSPRIAAYAGSGPLGAWVRITTVRVALDLLRANVRAAKAMDSSKLADQLASAPGPEAALLRAQYGPLLQSALETALTALDDREKAVLRFHFVEGLNIDAVGRVYSVHRATVARWLVDIRQRLLQAVEKQLATNVQASPSDFRSLLGLVRDDLRASLSRILGR